MIPFVKGRNIGSILILWTALAATLVEASDLSSYRKFQLGMKLPAVLKLTESKSTEAKAIHQRPELIQELDWQPFPSSDKAANEGPIKGVLFSFRGGELFRMVVTYDRQKTEGLTVDDMVEAISGTYGSPTRPDVEIVFPSMYNETVKVTARWEDADYSLNLVRSSFHPTFGLVMFSKRLDALAQTTIEEALRLDLQEAPQRETARREKQDNEVRLRDEKARVQNKGSFRP